MLYNKTRKGGRIGIMNPSFGGKRRRRPRNTLETLLNVSEMIAGAKDTTKMIAGAKDATHNECSLNDTISSNLMRGGGCQCNGVPSMTKTTPISGGYRATKRNLKYLELWKKGKSIGFTMRSSLKAKGLIPRANGKKHISIKYR